MTSNSTPGSGYTGNGYTTALTGLFGNITNPLDGGGTLYRVAPEARHLEGSNYLFADGHAKWLKGSNVSYGNNNDLADETDCGNNWRSAKAACARYQATFGIY